MDGTEPTDPATVKRALRALADGTAPPVEAHGGSTDRSPNELTEPPTAIVDRAHESLTEIESAAEFVADGGLDKLQAAIAAADRSGQHDLVRAGQRALASVQRYRRAAAGDHFHPGRGTVFRPDSEVTAE